MIQNTCERQNFFSIFLLFSPRDFFTSDFGIMSTVSALVPLYGLDKRKRTLSLSPFANVTQAFTLCATKTAENTKNFDHSTSERGLFPH